MDLNVSIPKIRPCPFCGNRELRTLSSAGEWFVYCPTCRSIGPHGDVDTARKEFPDEAVASVAAKILAIEMWNDCPRKYLTVDDLNDEELYELKQNHYIKEHPDNDLEGDFDDVYTDDEIRELYKDDNFVKDDFFCNGGK